MALNPATEYNLGGLVKDADGRLLVSLTDGDNTGQQYGVINTAASGVTALVAAAGAGLRIKVTKLFLVATGAVAVKFQSGATDLTGPMSLAANGGLVLPPGGIWFETTANAALNINLSGAVQVSGAFTYQVA